MIFNLKKVINSMFYVEKNQIFTAWKIKNQKGYIIRVSNTGKCWKSIVIANYYKQMIKNFLGKEHRI